MTQRVTNLQRYKDAPITWENLRHDRERRIYVEGYWRGSKDRLRFEESRNAELAVLSPEDREQYHCLVLLMEGGEAQ